MSMREWHNLWHCICMCLVATANCEEEGRPFCTWPPKNQCRVND